MKNFITGEQIPADFFYFRSQSPVYRRYLIKGGLCIIDAFSQFWWLKNFKIFQIAKFERTHFEPTFALIEPFGFKHGVLLWIPGSTVVPPPEWRTLWIPGSHFVSTGITRVLPDYFKNWNDRAQRARKKFLKHTELTISKVNSDEFIRCFKLISVKHSFKKDYIKYYLSMSNLWPESVRAYVVYDSVWFPIAWLAVHDFNNTSVHLVAFTGNDAKPVQAGTWLVDRWFSDSLALGLKYIHFDHLRDSHMTLDQQWYTDFKLNFIETPIRYPKCFFKIR